MNLFNWFPFFKIRKEEKYPISKELLNAEHGKAIERSKGRIIRRLPSYESPHDEVERIRRRQSDDSLSNDIITASIASSLFDDSSSYNSYDSDNHSHSSSFDSGFGGGDYSGGGSGGDWGNSDSSSYDSGSSSDYSSND